MRLFQGARIDRIVLAAVWVLIALLYAVLVYQIVRKIAGGSWDIEEITLTVVTVLAGVLTTIYAQLNSTVQKLSGSFEQFEKRFERLEQRVGSVEHSLAAKTARR